MSGVLKNRRRLEFRIPISPNRSFFAQVRFFDASLRRLGGDYAQALLTVVVGDNCDIDHVRDLNTWSKHRPVQWLRTPDEVFNNYGLHGTANWRFFPEPIGDIIILSDADTVLVRNIDPVLTLLRDDAPAIAGHMAHFPPPILSDGRFPSADLAEFWPRLFEAFGAPFPSRLYRYSMDIDGNFPRTPAYFNLGFVALNRPALEIFRSNIFAFEDAFRSQADSWMRCQIACTIIAHSHNIRTEMLSAAYNAANDARHFYHNNLTIESMRVIHYLRNDEIDRTRILLPEEIGTFLSAKLANPVNKALQRLARELAPALKGTNDAVPSSWNALRSILSFRKVRVNSSRRMKFEATRR